VNEYDAMGARLKQIKTSGGTATETRMVYALGRVIQERDSSDAVTARYYWGDVAAGNGQTVFKKDNGDSAKYLVPDGRGSPLQNLNKDGTLAGARAYDAFGVTNYSSGTALTPFELSANMRVNGSHLTLTPVNRALYPELGRAVTGWFRLTHLNGIGGAGGGAGGSGVGGVRCIGGRLAESQASCRQKACSLGICCSECFSGIQDCGNYKLANCPAGEPVAGVPVAFGKCCRGGAQCTGVCCEACNGVDPCKCKRTAGIVPLGAVPWLCLMPGFPREWCRWVPGCVVDCWNDPTFAFFVYAEPAGWDRCYACIDKNCPCSGSLPAPPPPAPPQDDCLSQPSPEECEACCNRPDNDWVLRCREEPGCAFARALCWASCVSELNPILCYLCWVDPCDKLIAEYCGAAVRKRCREACWEH